MSGFSTTAIADVYVGIGIGSASFKVDLGADGNFEETGTGTKLYSGYAFNKYLAAEITAYNFSEASVGAFELSPGGSVVVGAAASMKGLGAYGVAMYPLSKNVNLLAKLGVLSWSADISANGNAGTNDGTDVAYALAASYAFTKELLATVEWESFNTDNPELSLLSLGFRFNFR
jgi:OOP family OmpA-OmpF porin